MANSDVKRPLHESHFSQSSEKWDAPIFPIPDSPSSFPGAGIRERLHRGFAAGRRWGGDSYEGVVLADDWMVRPTKRGKGGAPSDLIVLELFVAEGGHGVCANRLFGGG